jgi:hypothetical protein
VEKIITVHKRKEKTAEREILGSNVLKAVFLFVSATILIRFFTLSRQVQISSRVTGISHTATLFISCTISHS